MTNPLINKDFALLAIGQFVSSIGDNVHRVALVWWVYNVTGSPSITGMLSLASMIPAIVLSPYMGVLADKWDRRRIVYGMDYLRGAIIASVALLSFAGKLEVWHMVLSSVLISACSSLFNPAVS
ncbi:MAG TPA: MFS transporter, partial [Bacillota bacterium]|nr:MFS transporter [Bacillota bacterium]